MTRLLPLARGAIAAPLNGAVVTTANPTLLASVVSNGNPVNKVEFFSGTTFLGTARSAPYALVWSNLVSGAYSVSARAWYGPAKAGNGEVALFVTGGDHAWKEFSVVVTAPPAATEILFYLRKQDKTTGTAFYDDVCIEPTDEKPGTGADKR